MRAFFVHLLVFCAFQAKCYDSFYWREIMIGFPSDDALEVSPGVYIGLAPLSISEICVGTYTKESLYLEVACNGYKTTGHPLFVKILCTERPQDFAWLRTSTDTFFNDTEGKTLVQGGFVYDPYYGPLSIARTMVDGDFVVGNLRPWDYYYPLDSPVLMYAYNGTEQNTDSYEVLIYMG